MKVLWIRFFTCLLAAGLYSLSLVTLVTAQTASPLPLTITTVNGTLQGTTTKNGLNVYRGIPYAAAPTGANRWREPQPVAAWSGLRDATRFAPRCIQGGFAPGADQPLTSEDCLYLNVWSPAPNADALLPVIVWIHGGGFFTGAGSADIYDGANLASKGAVVITINYRLGTFGFFAHPELTAESEHHSSGNYAMLDMVSALEWVYENVAAFGGDPINVTIVGESAGAQAVATLLASPTSAGLFHHAIMQSGGWMGLSMGKLPTLAETEALGAQQAASFGARSLSELRAASAQEIFENFPGGGSVSVDGYVLPEDPSLIYSANRHHTVDVLVGSNANEAVFFGPGLQTTEAVTDYASSKFGALGAQFLQLYPAGSDAQANQSYLQAYSNELAWQMRALALTQGQRGMGAWVYYFSHVPPGQEARGATHVAELAYMFNQHDQNQAWTAGDRTLSDTMAQYWVNFAARSNPNGQGLPQWPAYRSHEAGNVMVFGDSAAAETQQIPSAAALDFFGRAWQQHVETLK